MKSLRKTWGIQPGSLNRGFHHGRRGRKSQPSFTVGLLMPHKQLLNLIICLTPYQDKFSALLIQKGKLEHCIPMCAPSLITATNDGFTKGAN